MIHVKATELTLPTTSNNGITGVWSPQFDPNNTTTYTFEPDDGQCASTAEMTCSYNSKYNTRIYSD
jgi:serine protease inhibitor